MKDKYRMIAVLLSVVLTVTAIGATTELAPAVGKNKGAKQTLSNQKSSSNVSKNTKAKQDKQTQKVSEASADQNEDEDSSANVDGEKSFSISAISFFDWILLGLDIVITGLVIWMLYLVIAGVRKRAEANDELGTKINKARDVIKGHIDGFCNIDNLKKQINELENKSRSANIALMTEKNRFAETQKKLDAEIGEKQKLVSAFNATEGELAKTIGELAKTQGELAETKGELAKKEEEYNTLNNTLVSLLGEDVIEITGDEIPEESCLKVILLSLSKMLAMKNGNVKENLLLDEFRNFDKQLPAVIADDKKLQELRDKLLPLLQKLLPAYKIMWPTIGTNISEYKSADYVLDADSKGTTVAKVKCAAIYFADEDVPFQQANVVTK